MTFNLYNKSIIYFNAQISLDLASENPLDLTATDCDITLGAFPYFLTQENV